MTVLEVEHLSIRFGSDRGIIHAVDDVSFQIDRGEKVALVGESGAGKSVTGLSIMGLIGSNGHVDATIKWKGDNLREKDESELNDIRGNEIAWIPQNPLSALNPTATIGKQLIETMELHNYGSKKEIEQRALKLLRDTGIPDPEEGLEKYPHEYSGGMRQRVLIAISLSCNPDLIIADEPTTALDVITQAQIITLLNELVEQYETSLLLITHDLGLVKDICEKMMVMYAGEIVERSSIETLFANPLHPYTEALIECSPSLSTKDEQLQAIPGSVPEGTNYPEGCRFHPRCSKAFEDCPRINPELLNENEEQEVACLLYE